MKSLVFALALGWLAGQSLVAAESWHGDPERAAAELERQWPRVNQPDAALPIRGTVHFALEATGIGWHPERVLVALDRARAMQDRSPGSRTYGNFKWQSEQDRVFDLNAVEFAMQMLGLMHRLYGDRLTPQVRRSLEDLMVPAIDALRTHRVKIDYTNIFLMKAWDLIAAGETLGRRDVAEDGYRRFDEWLRFTATHGIVEYGAVTYYGVDLDSLVFIAKFAGRADARRKATIALQYLWTDIAANWWAPGDRLAGTNSRSYDYVYGRGYLEAHTWTAGWLRARPELESANWLPGRHDNESVFRDAATFVPPAEWTAPIRQTVPRIVVQRWGRDAEHHAIDWIGHAVSIASSGASHGSDERTLVANLGDSPAVPQITVFMDGRGDPFGTKKTANAAGQRKALHLTPFIAAVQRGPEVLQVLSEDPRGPKSRFKPGELVCFLTHTTVPAGADIWIDEARVRPTANGRVDVPPTASVFLRLGNAVIGIKYLLATTVKGERAPIQYVVNSLTAPARRITVIHSESEPKGRGTVVLYLRAAEGLDDAQFAAFRKTFRATSAHAELNGAIVNGEVAGLAGALRIQADVVKGERRVLEGGEPDALLSVNGRDFGYEILRDFATP